MWGTLQADGTARILTFARDIPHPIEKVWSALITPARLADWMCADADIDPRVGGRYHLAFRNGPHVMDGQITRFDPPHTLEFTWPETAANGNSLVLWRLSSTPGGCRLILTHTLPDGGEMLDFASGWHWHVDALADSCNGVAASWSEAAWRGLKVQYTERFAAEI